MKLDSDEERYFLWWLEELTKYGYIVSFEKDPEFWELSLPVSVDYLKPYKKRDGGKFTSEELLKGHSYTTDFKIIWTEKALNVFTTDLQSDLRKKDKGSMKYILCTRDDISGQYYSYVEVKPSFDRNNMTRLAKINVKWVWDSYGEFVNIVIPQKHFSKTFTPTRYLTNNIKQTPRKINYAPVRTLKAFIDQV